MAEHQCRTFTHHVATAAGDVIRVECTRHMTFVVDVPGQPKDAKPTQREIVTKTQRRHEQAGAEQ